MDMNERVAARRAEMEREELQAKAAAGETAKVQREADAAADEKDRVRQSAAMEGIFDGLFGDANAAGVKIEREGDDVVLKEERKPAKIDRAGMRRGKVNRMVDLRHRGNGGRDSLRCSDPRCGDVRVQPLAPCRHQYEVPSRTAS